jgi:hypothetical protein
MQMRGSWLTVLKFAGMTALVLTLGLLATLRNPRKRVAETRTTASPLATKEASTPAPSQHDPKWIEAYGKLPLSFEKNDGRTAQEVSYVAHGTGYELFLTAQEAVLALRPTIANNLSRRHRAAAIRTISEAGQREPLTVVRMSLNGANRDPEIVGLDQLPGKANYFIGNDPKKWRTGVQSYARVKYATVYPGVDLVYYGNQSRLEYDFVVAPGADPKQIALKIGGAQKMRVNSGGDLVLTVANGEVALQKPMVYQNVRGERHRVTSKYAIGRDQLIRFAIGSYDRSEPLILDPVLNYSTYLGGTAADRALAIAVDGVGNAFLAGVTSSTNFPTGTHVGFGTSPSPNLGASFVAELNPAGTQLLYSSYFAGSVTSPLEGALGIAIDTAGKVYVTGATFATDFPMSSPIAGFRPGPNPSNVNGTSYIVKFDPAVSGNGSLLYSSYIGGTNGTSFFGGDFGQAIAVDSSNPPNGIAYVVGYTDSTATATLTSLPNFPVVNGFQATLNSPDGNAFLAKIDTTKSGNPSLVYSTYLGGSGANAATRLSFGDDAMGVAVDANGNAYLAGATASTDFPTNGAVAASQPNAPTGNSQGTTFVTKIDTTKASAPISAQLIYSTYLGGEAFEQANAIALGPNNVAYVTGTTESLQFPVFPKAPATGSPFQTTGHVTGTAFVSLIDTGVAGGGSATLKYSTFLGGTGSDTGFGIKVDSQGNAYVAGTTASTDFPFPPTASIMGGFEPTYPVGAASVGFFAKLNPGGNGTADLLYSTYFGGIGAANGDHVFALAIDSANPANAYVTGETFSTAATFPVFPIVAPAAFQTALSGTSDTFVAKLTPMPTLSVTPTSLAFDTILIPNTSPAQSVTLTNNTNAAIAFASAAISGGSPGAANADYVISANTCVVSNIAAGASCAVSVTFKPTVAGAETANLVLTDADITSPQTISLTGAGSNTPPDFTVTAPATATVTNGSQVPFTVTVTPVGGFTSQVDLTCTSAPTLTLGTCVPLPVSVTTTDGVTPKPSTVTVTTTAFMVPPPSPRTPPLSIRQIVPLLLALMLLFMLPRTRPLRMRLAMFTAMIFFAVLAGCSGPITPHPHTQPGPYTLTVTGTLHGGATAHSATVNLTVN